MAPDRREPRGSGCGAKSLARRRTVIGEGPLAMTEFFPPQPNLYTVEAHGRPVVVISATSSEPPSDKMLANPRVIEALRRTRQLEADMAKELSVDPNEFEEGVSVHEIDEALETYLGDDLQTMEGADSPGGALWDGNWENIHTRRATDVEAEQWKQSLLAAMQAGEQEPGDTDWVAFLVAVRPMHDEECRSRSSSDPS